MSAEVAIVILTKNNPDLVSQCVESILKHTHTVVLKFYICDTGSSVEAKRQLRNILRDKLTSDSCTYIEFDNYHFAANNNYIIRQYVEEPYILLCNDDIILHNDCIDQMYETITSNSDVATAGCRLLFPSGTIQHAGQHIYLDPTGLLQCVHRGYGTHAIYKNEPVVGCTAACLLVDKSKFTKCSGFDESYTECWEDIQLNMRLVLAGYTNWYVDTAVATHLESYTRTKTKQAKYRLRYDYTYQLKPWFDSLPTQAQQLLLQS